MVRYRHWQRIGSHSRKHEHIVYLSIHVNLWIPLKLKDSRFYKVHAWSLNDDVIKWRHFSRYWPFMRGIHRSPVNSPHKSQWRGALMFSLICTRINGWANNGEAGDLRRYRAHCDVIVMNINHNIYSSPRIHYKVNWLLAQRWYYLNFIHILANVSKWYTVTYIMYINTIRTMLWIE